ncbi:MAG: hypothetical protein QM607_01970 [Microbacterium sp.]
MVDARVLIVVNAAASGPRRAEGWLTQAGLEPDVRVGADGLPSTLGGYDALVLLDGGRMPDDSAPAPWLAQERAFAAEAAA